jgi:hypothetical protein
LAVAASAQAPADKVLTNSDIVRMARAGIPEGAIIREIQMSETGFSTSPDALIELKRQGVSDRTLDAILDSRSGASRTYPGSLPATHGPAQTSAAVFHHLPSIDANVRLNSKTVAKVSVRQNQIKVEKAGVPLFSVQWKVNRTP